MPIWLRKFHIKKIQQYHEEVRKENEKITNQNSGTSKPAINR